MNLQNNCSEFGILMTRASLPIFFIVDSGDLLILTLSRLCGTVTRHVTIHEMNSNNKKTGQDCNLWSSRPEKEIKEH